MHKLLEYDSPVTLVELRPRSFGKLDGAELPDTYGTAKYPPRALPLLHAVAQKAGFTNVKSITPAFNRSRVSIPLLNNNGELTAENWVRLRQRGGVVGVSAVSRTVDVSLDLLQAIKSMEPDVLTVIGGYHATFDLEYCLKRGADVVVIKEGDETVPDLLTNLVKKGTYKGTLGIAYMKDGRVVQEKERPRRSREQLSQLPLPVYDKQVLKDQSSCTMWRGRGCPNRCTFCSVSAFNDGKYRLRSLEATLEEWKMVPSKKRLFWIDDEFAADIVRTKQLLEAGIRLNLHPLGTVQLPVGAAKDRELVELLKRAGCTAVAIGFEAEDEEVLQEMHKRATAEDNEIAAEVFSKAGIPILGMFILGLDKDTPESIDRRIDWAIRHVTWGQFSIRLPLVGTPDTAKLRVEGRLLSEKYGTDPKYYLYDGYHALFEPVHLSALGLQKKGVEAYKRFYALGRSRFDGTDIKYRLYAQYAIPRIENDPQTVEHRQFLESIERPRLFSKAEISPEAS